MRVWLCFLVMGCASSPSEPEGSSGAEVEAVRAEAAITPARLHFDAEACRVVGLPASIGDRLLLEGIDEDRGVPFLVEASVTRGRTEASEVESMLLGALTDEGSAPPAMLAPAEQLERCCAGEAEACRDALREPAVDERWAEVPLDDVERATRCHCTDGRIEADRSACSSEHEDDESASCVGLAGQALVAGVRYRIWAPDEDGRLAQDAPYVERLRSSDRWERVTADVAFVTGDHGCERHGYGGGLRAWTSTTHAALLVGMSLSGPSSSECAPGEHFAIHRARRVTPAGRSGSLRA